MRLINLIPLQEIDFPSQGAFDRYNKQHKLRPDTKVVVAGRVTTAGRAAQNSPTPAKGTSVFGGDKKPDASLNGTSTLNKPKKPTFGPGGTEPSWGDKTKDDFYNAGETLRQMGWKPDDIAKRIGDNLPDIDDEKDIPMMKNSDDKEDWINLYKKSIAMKNAGYSSSEIADKLRANL